ncbi:hypothetical protein ACFE04_018773 [Oxalis oulophora]
MASSILISPSGPGGASSPAISTVHSDIMYTHILTHLDGLTLVSAACASSHLNSLVTEDNKIWRDLTSSMWPSINDPRVQNVISTFSSGHRSLFYDSFPLLDYRQIISNNKINGCDYNNSSSDKLISAVDIFYKGELIFSKFKETETITCGFNCCPFRVELLDPKDSFQIEIPDPDHIEVTGSDEYHKDTWQEYLLRSLTLSWILIDPTRKRAVNLSSGKAVCEVEKWLTGEVHVKFAVVVPGTATEVVECAVMVTCGLGSEGKVRVREVSLGVEDMKGNNLNGKDSLVILQGAMERVKRVRDKKGGGGKERYEEFVKQKREKEIKEAGRGDNIGRYLDQFLLNIGHLNRNPGTDAGF